MKINSFLWNNYLNNSGKETVKLFENLLDFDFLSKNYSTLHKDLIKVCEYFDFNDLSECLQTFFEYSDSFLYSVNCKNPTISTTMKSLFTFLKEDEVDTDSEKFNLFITFIECYTLGLSLKLPNLFIPWFFQYSFNLFELICDYFEIELDFSKIPAKSDYTGRFMYYGDICEALQKFRKNNSLSPAELCAFLYDYAPKLILSEKSIIEEITEEPRNAYFIGSPKDDDFFESLNADSISFWQSHPDTQVGDALIMYVRTPVSQIKYIWRAVTPGFIDPFFWYYRCTYIGNPIKIEGMTIKELKSDPVTKNEPIVRKNMQGVNGTPIRPSVYNHILDICKTDNKENLPYIKYALGLKNDKEISNEHDVEVILLEPMLEKLGYKKEHWCRQMVTKMGRREREIPDYVIFPIHTPGKERGKIVLEAKHTIPNNKQLEYDRRQVASYGKALLSEYVVLVSKEGIYLYYKYDNFDNYIYNCSWIELQENKDCFNKLYRYIGYKNK
ncbi:MAG: hypothetical protein UHY68_04255 [Acutalibacteraceae bacterium]|nr:hypothetical protein [Acutalibacteraceae bacterium]